MKAKDVEIPLRPLKTDAVTRSAQTCRERLIQQGRKEVVEWIERHTLSTISLPDGSTFNYQKSEEWQAFKKAKGL